MFHLSKTARLSSRQPTQVRCFSDITPEIIEKKRLSLKTQYYSLQRHMTINEMNMILRPLFKDTTLEIAVVHDKVHVLLKNVATQRMETDTTAAIIDLITIHTKSRLEVRQGVDRRREMAEICTL
jgi:hypothetical protein